MRELSQNLSKASSTITEAIKNTNASRYQILTALNQLLGQFGINNNTLKSKQYTTGYASGTKRVGKTTTAYTMEDGRELIFTKNGILTQLKPNDAVMNNKLTEQFFEAAKNYPMMEKMYSKVVHNGMTTNVTTPVGVSPTINCPITINGTDMTPDQVKDILNGFIPKISREVSKTVQSDIAKDLRKAGR